MRKLLAAISLMSLSSTVPASGIFDGIWYKDAITSNNFAVFYQSAPNAQGVASLYKVFVTHTGGLSGSWDGTAIITPAPTSVNVLTSVTVSSALGTKTQNVVFSSLTSATATLMSCTPAPGAPPEFCGPIGRVRTWTKLE